MTLRQLATYIVTCDGCGRRLTISGHDVFANTAEAQRVADYLGWATHPDGTHYCPEGGYQ